MPEPSKVASVARQLEQSSSDPHVKKLAEAVGQLALEVENMRKELRALAARSAG